MRATEFEYRYQTLVHLLIVSAAFLTYLVDRDDIVWALVRDGAHPHLFERLLFALATILIGASTALRTWARAWTVPAHTPPFRRDGPYRYFRYPQQLGSLVFSVGLAFLAPLAGFLILVIGESIVFLRLVGRERELAQTGMTASEPQQSQKHQFALKPAWGVAIRRESGKWGLFLTMVVFTILLRDRLAEVLAVASLALWALLNFASFQPLISR